MLSAFAQLKKEGVDEKLALVGKKDWMFGNIHAHVESLGVATSVISTGYVPSSDLPAFYNAAEAFVFPSIFEGFGLPVMEAMACGLLVLEAMAYGTPTITSRGSALEEIAGGAALLVDPYDSSEIRFAIERVLSDTDLRTRLRRLGLARSQQFSWRRMAEETQIIYKPVMSHFARAVKATS